MRINRQAGEKLMKYAWPGNIRELQHTIEKAVILSESNVLKPEDLFVKNSSQPVNQGFFYPRGDGTSDDATGSGSE